MTKKKKQVEQESTSYTKIKEKHTALEAKLSSDEELLQTLLTGLSSKGAKNQGGGYMGALADARARIAQGAAEEQQSKVKLGMSEKELAELEQRNRAFAKEAEASMKKIANIKAAVQALEAKVVNCGWSQEKDQDFERQLREAREQLKNLTEVCFCVISLISNLLNSFIWYTSNATASNPASGDSTSIMKILHPTLTEER